MGSAADVILLSSSPANNTSSRTPAPPTYDPETLFGISPCDSSPINVPSPSELFRPPTRSRFFEAEGRADEPRHNNKKKGSKGSKAITVETDKAALEEKEILVTDKPKRGRPKGSSKPKTSPSDLDSSVTEHKDNASKKPTEAKEKTRTDGTSKRANTINKTLTGRVAKAGNLPAKGTDEKTENGPPTPGLSPVQKPANGAFDYETDDLQLDAATKRRMDWTPTKDTTKQVIELEDVDKEKPRQFGNLMAEYNFSGDCSAPLNDTRSSEDGGPTKRRRIELVDSRLNPASKEVSPDTEDKTSTEDDLLSAASEPKKKPGRKPKKLTTITARVTARYNTDYAESTDQTSTVEDQTATKPKNSKSKSKAKAKTVPEPEFIVLSPEAAAKSLEDQDLIFGTCSQLEREDSPTMLSDMQAAILESEKSLRTEPRSSLFSSSRLGPSSATVSRFQTPRNLWSVAARDSEGSLIQAEMLDLVDKPDLSKALSTTSSPTRKEKRNTKVDDVDDRPLEGSERKDDSSMDKEPPAVATQTDKTTRNLEKISSQTEAHPPMPQFTALTDAELSKQVATYGFKAVRNRKKMIELLQRCWESKHGTSTSVVPEAGKQNTPVESTSKPTSSQAQAAEPKTRKTKSSQKTAAKPKKAPAAKSKASTSASGSTKQPDVQAAPKQAPSKSYIDVEEIQDSEDETIPSPSRLQHQYNRHTTESRQTLHTSTIPSPSRATSKIHARASATAAKVALPDIADQITKAVRTQPQLASAASRKRHTWHEKMLMYDPIILEDFTAWLNTEGLNLVGEDREVGVAVVRKWCERRGVCCCYR